MKWAWTIESSFMGPALQGLLALKQVEKDLGAQIPVTYWESVVPKEELAEWAHLDRHGVYNRKAPVAHERIVGTECLELIIP